MRRCAVYVMSNASDSVLYVGVTGDLVRSAFEHREGLSEGFTKRYGLKKLVYFEVHEDIRSAITREKQLKGGSRKKKLDLIRTANPSFRDLFSEL